MVGHQPRLVDLHPRIDEPKRDGLVGVDRRAERLALLGVLDGVVERCASHANLARCQQHTRLVELLHQATKALALAADATILRQKDVLEEDLVRRNAALAELVQLVADAKALVTGLDDERRDALRARARGDRREDEVVLGHAGVRDPRLRAIQQVATLDGLGVCRDRAGIGARLGLGRRECTELRVGSAERRYPTRLLRLGTELDNDARKERGRANKVANRRVAVRQLLMDQAGSREVGDAAATKFFRQVVRGEPKLGGLVKRLPRRLLRLVVVRSDGPNLLLGKRARKRNELLLNIAWRHRHQQPLSSTQQMCELSHTCYARRK